MLWCSTTLVVGAGQKVDANVRSLAPDHKGKVAVHFGEADQFTLIGERYELAALLEGVVQAIYDTAPGAEHNTLSDAEYDAKAEARS